MNNGLKQLKTKTQRCSLLRFKIVAIVLSKFAAIILSKVAATIIYRVAAFKNCYSYHQLF